MRDIIGIGSLSKKDFDEIHETADLIRANKSECSTYLSGKTLLPLFYTASSRTMLSFNKAIIELGGAVIPGFTKTGSSVAKGESFGDTIKMACSYEPTFLVIRRDGEGAAFMATKYADELIEKHPEIEKYCSVMEFLDDHGQFVRIFLNELLLLERELFSSFPRKKLEEESRAFLEFLDTTLVSREAGEEVPLIFEGENIRVKILMIAKPEKILSADWTNPYEKRVEEAIQKGIKNIYLLGRGMNTFAVKKVASCFEKRDEVMISSSREYNLHYKGKRVKAICVLLKVLGQE